MTLLTVDQAAEHLATKTRFIRRLIAERRIPYVMLGSHVRLDTADLDAFITAGRVTPAAADSRCRGVGPAIHKPSPRTRNQGRSRRG